MNKLTSQYPSQHTCKAQIKRITLHWAEGLWNNHNPEDVAFATLAEAQRAANWILNDFNKDGHRDGYNKSKWAIEWADGETYRFRLDINDKESNIAEYVRHNWLVYSGLKRPAWMDDEQYADFYRNCVKPDNWVWLEMYALE